MLVSIDDRTEVFLLIAETELLFVVFPCWTGRYALGEVEGQSARSIGNTGRGKQRSLTFAQTDVGLAQSVLNCFNAVQCF